MVIILGGLDGSSKSYSSMQWATAGLDDHSRPSIFLDLEYPRAKKLHQVHFSGTTIEIVNCKVIYQKSDEKQGIRRGERDPIKSFELLEKKVIEILDNFEKYGCIVIDGISDIRSDYSKVWLKEYNLREKKNRQTIGKDPGAWADINSRIIEMIVSPMQELGDFYNTRVIMTSMMGDDYKLIKLENGKQDTVKTGSKHIDVHQDIRHKVDTICLLEHDADKYYVSIQKSIRGSTDRKRMERPLWELLMEADII